MTDKEFIKVWGEKYKKDIQNYINEVLTHTERHSETEILMVKRAKNEKNGEFVFSWSDALFPLCWITKNMKFPSGANMGHPMVFQPWQSFIVSQLFGWSDKDGARKYRNAYIEVPRKNGKSTFIGALCGYMAFSKKECDGSPCYVGATTLDQAGEVFERIANSLKHHKDMQIQNSKNNKQIIWKNGRVIGISGEPKDGKLSHFAVIDEYHQHKTNKLINSIASGNVSDDRSMLVRITTAGTDLFGVCKQEHDKALRILQGEENESYFVAIYTIDKDDDIADPNSWRKANPNWGVSVSEKSYKAQYENCKHSQIELIDFKTKNLNVWVNGLDRWANMDKWNTLCNIEFDESIFTDGGATYGGLDLSTVKDFTALTIDRYNEGVHYLKNWYFIPEGQVYQLEQTLRVPLRDWVAEGKVVATPGDVIDYGLLAEYIKEIKEKYNLELLGCDKWKLDYLANLMPDWFGEVAFEFSQGLKTMSPTIKEFERLYLTGKIQANNDPVLRWMMSNAEIRSDGNDNVKLEKPKRDGVRAARIDGVISSIMAVDTARTHGEIENIDLNNLVSII